MDPLNVAIVVLLFAAVGLIEWADKRDLLARGLDRARVRLGRRIPFGVHRIEGEVRFHFGRDDAILIITVPLSEPSGQRVRACVGATDAATRFTVNDEVATPDELLTAYDDEIGPLVIRVEEPGRIAALGIASEEHQSVG